MERPPLEEETVIDPEQAEQLIQDHIRQQYQMRLKRMGAVGGLELLAILETLGLVIEPEELRPLLSDWDHCTLVQCQEVVRIVRGAQGLELKSILARMEEHTLYLTPWQWMFYDEQQSTDYKTVKVTFQVAPRHLLFISTGFVLMITGAAILVLMSILWLAQANERERVQMSNFHLLLSSFTESFELHFMGVHAETMVDQADTLAKMINQQQLVRTKSIFQELQDEAIIAAELLTTVEESVFAGLRNPADALAGTLLDLVAMNKLFPNSTTLDDIRTLVAEWTSRDGGWESIVLGYGLNGSSALTIATTADYSDCPSSTCAEFSIVECLNWSLLAAASSPTWFASTANPRGVSGSALGFYISDFNATVCLFLPQQQAMEKLYQSLASTAADYNDVYKDKYLSRMELLLGLDVGQPKVRWISDRVRIESQCYQSLANPNSCLGLDQVVRNITRTNSPYNVRTTGYSGDDLIVGAAITPKKVAVVVNLRMEAFLQNRRDEIVSIMDYLNFNTDRTTELSIGRRDPTTGVIQPQLNRFRFSQLCHGPCTRWTASSQSATTAIVTQHSGWLIAPDYRPEPVVGAYAYIGQGLDLSIVVERDVHEIRSIGLAALVSIFNDNNRKYTGSLEAQFVRFKGTPAMWIFDRYQRCDNIRDCIQVEGEGVLYRSDCVHCSRAPVPASDDIVFLTDLKLMDDCITRRGNCSEEALYRDNGAARQALLSGDSSKVIVTTDYRNVEVLAVVSYVKNFSVGLVVKLDTSEINRPIQSMIGQAVGAAIGIVLFGLGILIFFSRKVLDKIELEWLAYKEQIDAEKYKFDRMVQDVIPASIRDSKNQRSISTLQNLSFIFLDICGLTERTKSWSPEIVCRYLTYFFTVVDSVAMEYQVNKVRLFGDTYFGVAGLSTGETQQQQQDHSATKAIKFGAVLVQLLQPKYAHYPHRIPFIEETFRDVVNKSGLSFPDVTGKPEDVGHVIMPTTRIGMHCGPGTFCIIETGRTPTYDVFGPGVALAARLQVTSQPNRIHVSGTMKEMLEKVDRNRLVDFEPPRKTVVKGQGTVSSYFLHSATVAVPAELLDDLGIEYANLRVQYESTEQTPGQENGVTADG